MAKSSRPRTGSLLAAAAAVALLALVLRLGLESRAELGRARAAEAAGSDREAIAFYLDAARAYFPGNPYAGRAFDGLWALAARAQQARDGDVERRALDAFRAG